MAAAFQADRSVLERAGYALQIQLSQPGFIRAMVSLSGHDAIRVDWAYDSAWRFLPPVRLQGAGYVLHPVDLAVNKVLALIGRDEPRDFVDVVYLHQQILPLGALAWAASGKDPGLNPDMILELLARRHLRNDDLARLDLAVCLDAAEQEAVYRGALAQGKRWIQSRPPEESGCLYRKPGSGLFFAPQDDQPYEIHRGSAGGVLPKTPSGDALVTDAAARKVLESFFERRILAD